jgi:retron-type reverse transcriptase
LTPQGAVISPLLAIVYLHYVFDLWAHRWRQHQIKGDVMVAFGKPTPTSASRHGSRQEP